VNNKNKSSSKQSLSFVYSILLKPCLAISLSTLAFSVNAELFEKVVASSVKEALEKGEAHIDFRLRYEDVNKANQGAQALTLRSRFGFETLNYELFTAFVELDDVRAIPNDANYNSGANGQFDDVLVEDPEGTELNQAWLAYDLVNTLIKFGRQTISLNNERLLGGDSWRQNEQTFSALSIQNETLNYTRVEFAQLNEVQTNQDKSLDSASQDINAKLLNLNYRGFWLSDLSLYALWISDHPDQRQWETSTYGINLTGKLGGDFSVAYLLDFAQQEDAGANPSSYSVGYSLIDLLFAYQGVQIKTGYERLGASKNGYFVTPLGSLHEFQGASDQFANNGLGNVQSGVQDRYIGLGYEMELSLCQEKIPLTVFANYHDYDVDTGVNNMSHLGEEWVIKANLETEDYQILLQFSDYHADQFSQDDRRLWLSLGMSF
tara:strand:- start:2429 stop:3730 length:1302 start_codon:yes stop_codon:yes gene_type:complete